MARAALDSPGDTLTTVEAALVAKRAAEADILCAAVTWADQHPGERIGAFGYTPKGSERAIRIGGEGTPLVQEFCHAELAVSLELHPLGARALMADALDLRHRLPSLWTFATVDLSLPEWVARKIARTTRELSGVQVAEVDRRLAEVATTLPTGRLLGLVEAMVLAATDEQADERRRRRLAARFVAIADGRHRSGQRELPTIYGHLDEADSVRLDEMLTRLAGVLADQGDPDTIDVRRSKALGLLADPARALATLTGRTRVIPRRRRWSSTSTSRRARSGVTRAAWPGSSRAVRSPWPTPARSSATRGSPSVPSSTSSTSAPQTPTSSPAACAKRS